MTLQRLWDVLRERVKEWRADSAFVDIRSHQRQAQEQMWDIVCRLSQLQIEILSHEEVRFWLVDVSPEMSSYSANGNLFVDRDYLVIKGIPDSLAPWQMVALDRLRFTGVDGVTAEIRCKPNNNKSWWVTLTWTAPALAN